MKKTRALLFSILLIALAFTSCNLDGTTGIFREIAQSKAPLSIRYKQLLGKDATYLYFRTEKGVERVTSPSNNTPVATSEKGRIIQGAALQGTKVFYITNDLTELNSGTVNVVDTTTLTALHTKITVTAAQAPSIATELAIKNLYANSMLLVTGKDGGGEKVFDLLEYDSVANFTTSLANFPIAEVPAKYDLESLIQQTGSEQDGLGTERSSLVSFVDPNGSNPALYKHYLVRTTAANDSSQKEIGANTIKVASYLYNPAINENIYILSTNGKLYYAGTYASSAAWVELSDSGRAFEAGAFAYTVIDGTNYHFITKPSLNTSALVVFTFAQTATLPAGVTRSTVQTGYAKDLSLVTIVSAQLNGSANKLLVATDVNGMYDITIVPFTAHLDDGSGTSVGPENYSF